MIHEDARAMASLKDMWIPNINTAHGRIAICARPVNDPSFIAHVAFEMLEEFAGDINVWAEIFSQLERWKHL